MQLGWSIMKSVNVKSTRGYIGYSEKDRFSKLNRNHSILYWDVRFVSHSFAHYIKLNCSHQKQLIYFSNIFRHGFFLTFNFSSSQTIFFNVQNDELVKLWGDPTYRQMDSLGFLMGALSTLNIWITHFHCKPNSLSEISRSLISQEWKTG